MSTAVTPLFDAAEKYLDTVEKNQKKVVDLVAKYAERVREITPERISELLAQAAPKAEDLERGQALVTRALALQQSFTRELVKVVAPPPAKPAAAPKAA